MLSSTCKYGIRAIVYIAVKSKNQDKIGIRRISEDLKLPMPFLAKILQSLARKKILESSKGPNGGFSLTRRPDEISLLEVAKAIDGNDLFSRCVLHNENCKSFDDTKIACTLHSDYVKARRRMEKVFESKTIQHLVISAKNTDEILI